MKLLPSTLLVVAVAHFAGVAQGLTVSTSVDTDLHEVRIDFTDLPPYEQIRLEGVTALFWCNCVDLDNPSSLMGTGFTVNGSNLEMKYEGSPPPSTNFISYHYLDGYVFTGFESVDWILVTELGGGAEVRLTGDRPIIVPVPEPSTGSLCLVGLTTMCLTRKFIGDSSVLVNGFHQPRIGRAS